MANPESPGAFNQNSSSYGAEQLRRAVLGIYGSAGGVFTSADLLATAPASGMSVNIAAGQAIVPGGSTTYQGKYYGLVNATLSVAVATSNPSNPRIDRVYAGITDSFYSGSTNTFTAAIVTGTPAGSPVEPSLPVSAIPNASLLVPAAATSIIAGDITDQRVLVGLGTVGAITGKAWRSTTYSLAAGSNTLALDTVTATGSPAFTISGGNLIVPVAGVYLVTVYVNISGWVSGDYYQTAPVYNGSAGSSGVMLGGTAGTYIGGAMSDVVSLTANETVSQNIYCSGGTPNFLGGSANQYVTATLLR